MIIICKFCFTSKVVPGPRNQKEVGLCDGLKCKEKAILFLRENGLATEAELESIGLKLDSAEGT